MAGKDRLPLIISKKRMDEVILAHMESEKDKEFILSSYMLVELRKGGTGERMTLPGWDASTVFRDYTVRLLEDSASDADGNRLSMKPPSGSLRSSSRTGRT